MDDKNNHNKKILREIKSVCEVLRRIDIWLPRAIDNALHGHKGTLDRVDIDERIKERKEDDKKRAEIDSLRRQVEEAQNQTREIQKQTKYLFWSFIVVAIGLMIDIILRIKPDFVNYLLGKCDL